MKIWIFIGLIVAAVAQNFNIRCPVGCTREYRPVCSTSSDRSQTMSFPNKCMMETYACGKNQSEKFNISVQKINEKSILT